MMFFIIFFAIFSVQHPMVYAQKTGVMDFEADVIEGELRRPELFLQMENNSMSVESMIYGRENFNDFNRIDKAWRVRYFEPKKPMKNPIKNAGKKQ